MGATGLIILGIGMAVMHAGAFAILTLAIAIILGLVGIITARGIPVAQKAWDTHFAWINRRWFCNRCGHDWEMEQAKDR